MHGKTLICAVVFTMKLSKHWIQTFQYSAQCYTLINKANVKSLEEVMQR